MVYWFWKREDVVVFQKSPCLIFNFFSGLCQMECSFFDALVHSIVAVHTQPSSKGLPPIAAFPPMLQSYIGIGKWFEWGVVWYLAGSFVDFLKIVSSHEKSCYCGLKLGLNSLMVKIKSNHFRDIKKCSIL